MKNGIERKKRKYFIHGSWTMVLAGYIGSGKWFTFKYNELLGIFLLIVSITLFVYGIVKYKK